MPVRPCAHHGLGQLHQPGSLTLIDREECVGRVHGDLPGSASQRALGACRSSIGASGAGMSRASMPPRVGRTGAGRDSGREPRRTASGQRAALVETCATPTRRGLDDGVPPNMVQRVMGHERSSTTLDLYTRRTDNSDRILRALDDSDEDDPNEE